MKTYNFRLCDTCFWKVQCKTHDDLIPDEDVFKCYDGYGGIDYIPYDWNKHEFIKNEFI